METANIEIVTIEQKRNQLKELSKQVSDLVTAGEFDTINEAIIKTFYKDPTHSEFKTFNQWKADGYSIIKGSKAFIVWGKPKKVQDTEKAAEQGKDAPADDSTHDFYPIAFLFSNAQVEIRKGKQDA